MKEIREEKNCQNPNLKYIQADQHKYHRYASSRQ